MTRLIPIKTKSGRVTGHVLAHWSNGLGWVTIPEKE